LIVFLYLQNQFISALYWISPTNNVWVAFIAFIAYSIFFRKTINTFQMPSYLRNSSSHVWPMSGYVQLNNTTQHQPQVSLYSYYTMIRVVTFSYQ